MVSLGKVRSAEGVEQKREALISHGYSVGIFSKGNWNLQLVSKIMWRHIKRVSVCSINKDTVHLMNKAFIYYLQGLIIIFKYFIALCHKS